MTGEEAAALRIAPRGTTLRARARGFCASLRASSLDEDEAAGVSLIGVGNGDCISVPLGPAVDEPQMDRSLYWLGAPWCEEGDAANGDCVSTGTSGISVLAELAEGTVAFLLILKTSV